MTLSQRIAAVAAVLLSAPVLLAPVAHADPGTFRTSGRIVVAQLAEPEAVLQARQDLLVAEQALLEAKAGGGGVKSARRARQALDQVLAAASGAQQPSTAQSDTNADQMDKAAAKKLRRKRKRMEAEAAAAAAQSADEARAAAQAQLEAEAAATQMEADKAAQKAANKAASKAEKKASKKAARKAAKMAAEQAAALAAAQAAAQQAAAQDNEPDQTGIKGQKVDPRLKKLRRKLRAARQENRELQNTVQPPAGAKVVRTKNGRTIIKDQSGQTFIQSHGNDDRSLRGARDVKVVKLRNGMTRTTIYRANGSQVITLRNRDGDIVVRFRRNKNGREFILVDNRNKPKRRDRRPRFNIQVNLPTAIQVPKREYVVELGRQTRREDIYKALSAPPVAQIQQPYSLDEILYNNQVRDLTRRVDLDAITFDTGSALILQSQIPGLSRLAYAIGDVLYQTPGALILIEGHTDAVGSEYYNLALSDQRAESVAIVLSESFGIPPENLITQGYGEAYLKISTYDAERRNRRVTARNLYGLMQTSQN